jgi:hypothetical protein
MKSIDSTGAPLVHVPGWMDGWMDGWIDGWMEVKAVLRIAYSNQQIIAYWKLIHCSTIQSRVTILKRLVFVLDTPSASLSF